MNSSITRSLFGPTLSVVLSRKMSWTEPPVVVWMRSLWITRAPSSMTRVGRPGGVPAVAGLTAPAAPISCAAPAPQASAMTARPRGSALKRIRMALP
jgi:hypothetical protein